MYASYRVKGNTAETVKSPTTQAAKKLSQGTSIRGSVSRVNAPKPQAPQTPAPSAPGSGSFVPSGPGAQAPAAPTSPTATAPQEPETYDLSALEQILAGIEAQYGLNREELLAGEGEAADLYRYVVANIRSAQAEALGQVQEQGIRRGILRSGIAQEENARVQQQFAAQQQQAQAQRDQQMADIALALQQLDADLNREKTETASEYANQNLQSERARAQALELV